MRTRRQSRALFVFEEYAGKGIFLGTWPFVKRKKKPNCAESDKESSDGKFQHPSACPFFPSPRGEKKGCHCEYAVHSKRVRHLRVQQPSGLQTTKLVEPAVSHLFLSGASITAVAHATMIIAGISLCFQTKTWLPFLNMS